MPRSLIPVIDELSEAALTVVAQTIDPTDQGMLKWAMFFPAEPVDSVDLDEVTTLDFRPVSGRRAWNAPGRLIPDKTPDFRNLTIVPVEGYFAWNEYAMQKLRQRAGNNAARVNEIIGNSIPRKVRQITEANWRRVEVDAFTAWALGTVTVMNPQTGATYVVSFGFDSARMTTAATAWNDPGVNAWNEFIAFMQDAPSYIGATEGALMDTPTMRAIVTDGPDINNSPITIGQARERISDELGRPFEFFLFDDTVENFTDGGTATASAPVWSAGRVAAVPAGGRVGRTAFAPVTRAQDLVEELGGSSEIDENGQTVYYTETNEGKELKVSVQVNPLTVPNEQKVFVINSGVS
jgi:hypothetical protein